MGIKFLCPDCGQKLNVKSFLAGKRGICPYCSARFRIPSDIQEEDEPQPVMQNTVAVSGAAGAPATVEMPPDPQLAAPTNPVLESNQQPPEGEPGSDVAPVAGAPPTTDGSGVPIAMPTAAPVDQTPVDDPIADAPNAVWYVRPPAGGQFGPATGEVMRKWLTEGRVGPDSLVWCEGWSEWKPAADIFSQLRQRPPQPAAPYTAASSETHPTMAPAPVPSPTPRAHPRRKSSNTVMITVILLGAASIGLLITLFFILNR